MSIRMRCQRCGRSSYSASAPAIVARGDRCPACGGPLELQCPVCGEGVPLPSRAHGHGGGDADGRRPRMPGD